MIQCFVKKEYEAPFGLTQMPRLFSVSRTDEKASAHPRVMHAHDDLVEIVLVRGSSSTAASCTMSRPDRIGRWQPRVWRLADWLCPDCVKIR